MGGGGVGQRCGVHQASLSAAVEAKRPFPKMLGLAASRRVAYYLWRYGQPYRAETSGGSALMMFQTPARLALRVYHTSKGGDAKPRNDMFGWALAFLSRVAFLTYSSGSVKVIGDFFSISPSSCTSLDAL